MSTRARFRQSASRASSIASASAPGRPLRGLKPWQTEPPSRTAGVYGMVLKPGSIVRRSWAGSGIFRRQFIPDKKARPLMEPGRRRWLAQDCAGRGLSHEGFGVPPRTAGAALRKRGIGAPLAEHVCSKRCEFGGEKLPKTRIRGPATRRRCPKVFLMPTSSWLGKSYLAPMKWLGAAEPWTSFLGHSRIYPVWPGSAYFPPGSPSASFRTSTASSRCPFMPPSIDMTR